MTHVTKHLQLDPASDIRLQWITAYLRHGLRMSAAESRPTIIMRRAIDAYQVHLERIMRLPDGHKDPTRDRDLAQGLERSRLRDMARDSDLGVPEEALITQPVRPLSAIVKEHAKGGLQEPKVGDWIRAQNERSNAKDACRSKARALNNEEDTDDDDDYDEEA